MEGGRGGEGKRWREGGEDGGREEGMDVEGGGREGAIR